MKSIAPEISQRYLVLIKIDAQNLFNRISERHSEYMEVFSLKRDRSIFKEIFSSRYDKTNLSDLAHLPIEVIELTNQFYLEVDELYWYLKHTQDMPNTIDDEIMRKTARIKRFFETLKLYIDAELSGTKLEHTERKEEIPTKTNTSDYFISEGELQEIEAKDDFIRERNDS